MNEYIGRMKENTKAAANRLKSSVVRQTADPSIRFYESLQEEDFRKLSYHYGIDRVSAFIKSMEFKKTGSGGK